MKILLTGATGFIGSALSLRLQRDGHHLTALVRDESRAQALLGEAVRLFSTDLDDAWLDALMEEADAVVNLAGAPVIGRRWTRRYRAVLRASRIDLTERLVASMKRVAHAPAVFVSASAVGYYGDRGAEPVTEETPPGSDFLARLCVDWERAATQASERGVRVAIPRIGVVLGREGGALDRMLPAFRLGLGGPVGSGRQYVSWIHLEDLVEMLATALTDARYAGPFNAVAPAPATFRIFAEALARRLGKPAALRVPGFGLKLLFGEAARVLLTGQRVLPRRALDRGFAFRFPDLPVALADLLDNSAVRIGDADSAPSSDYLRKHPPRYLLETNTRLPLPVDEVFPFFSRPENLGVLTPPKMQFRIEKKPERIEDGALIRYRLRVGGLPLRWTTRIERWRPNDGFVDSQLRGPYRCWWHEHTFEADGNGTLMRDRVWYAPPLGVLGRLAHRLFIADQLRRIFGYRATVMRLRFGTGSSRNPARDEPPASRRPALPIDS